MSIRDAARVAAAELSPAERLVVEEVLAEPAKVAFGTVAELAARSGTSGPTVVRVARKLGFDGYRALQAAAQEELTGALPLAPAAERIRRTGGGRADVVERALAVELANVESTLRSATSETVATAVALLADRRRPVLVLAGDAERGIAGTFADQLAHLRPGVEVLGGTPPRIAARLALVEAGTVAVAVDVQRYDAWLLDAADQLRAAGAALVAVTDGPLSPLVPGADAWFEVTAEGAGPFDSHVGTLALLHALVTATAGRLRGSATDRLDRVEAAWRVSGALRGS